MTVLERAASAEVVDDIVLPFAVESLSTRGRLVRLGPAIDQLLKRHDYPEPVSKLVAEAAALAALLGSTLKL
jgi:molecular chaperone Hsp33